ncbi:NAD(P)H-quinone oxidoreductase subunit U, chloroplastic [Typha angustifolia]|uniref:NAD(P)H-quinone oxidoreductase subunit U, chloroplastic n=1 Tax=Typha angustifolia TaxID=59011 RepID=UPI003C30C88C
MEMATLGIPSPAAKLTPRFSFRLRARNLTFRVRCSAEAAPGTATEEEGPVTPSRLPNSLISAANVQKALRGVAITEVDHYGRLGISRGTSYDQVIVAYEKKCEELMNKELDEEEMKEELELLKESYAILSSEDERRLYDWSLSRSERPDRYVWPFEVDITQTPKGTPPPQEPEDVGPTRLVGYFLLAWLVLSVVLSITLNIQ